MNLKECAERAKARFENDPKFEKTRAFIAKLNEAAKVNETQKENVDE